MVKRLFFPHPMSHGEGFTPPLPLPGTPTPFPRREPLRLSPSWSPPEPAKIPSKRPPEFSSNFDPLLGADLGRFRARFGGPSWPILRSFSGLVPVFFWTSFREPCLTPFGSVLGPKLRAKISKKRGRVVKNQHFRLYASELVSVAFPGPFWGRLGAQNWAEIDPKTPSETTPKTSPEKDPQKSRK